MSRTVAVHVRYKSLYISLPSSAKQQREMTKFYVLWKMQTTTANFSYFHLELKASVIYLVLVSSETDKHSEQIQKNMRNSNLDKR